MKNILILGLCLFLLGAGLIVSFADGFFGEADPDLGPDRPLLPPSAGGGAVQANKSPLVEGEGRRPLDQTKSKGAGQVGSLPSTIPLDTKIGVLVVDGRTGAPQPGALVAWYNRGLAQAGISRSLPLHLDWSFTCEHLCLTNGKDLMSDFGVTVKANENGIAQIPRFTTNRTWIRGRKGDLEGVVSMRNTISLNKDGDHFTFKLWPVRKARFRVVDISGQPVAKVPVALRSRGFNKRVENLWMGRTDANGMGSIRFLDPVQLNLMNRMYSAEDKAAMLKQLTYHLTILPACAANHEVAIFLDHLPQEIIRLTLPATGQVLVKVVDDQGKPWLKKKAVYLSEDLAHLGGPNVLSKFTRNGEARFPLVPLGLKLKVVVGRNSNNRKRIYGGQVGPVRPGEEVVLTLGGKISEPVFTGRAVDESGKAMAGIPLVYNNTILMTDERGRFSLYTSFRSFKGGRNFLFTWWRNTTQQGEARGWIGEVFVPGPLSKEGHEIGDVTFIADRILVRGRVVDDKGRPLYQARVDVKLVKDINRSPRDVGTDKDGRFVVRGIPRGPLTVNAAKKGYVEPFVATRVISPDKEVRLVLQRTGSMAYSLDLDWGIPREMIRYKIKCQGLTFGGAPRKMPVRRRIQGNLVRGNCYENAHPGIYTFQVRLGTTIMAEIRDITIDAGLCTRDPRLMPINLKGRCDLVRFKTPLGSKLPWREIKCQGLDKDSREVGEYAVEANDKGQYVTLVPKRVTKFVLGRDHHLPIIVAREGNEAVFPFNKLEPGISIVVTGEAPKGFHGSHWLVYRGPARGGIPAELMNRFIIRRGGFRSPEAVFSLPCAGPYEARWTYTNSQGYRDTLPQQNPVILNVSPTDEGRKYTVKLSKEDVLEGEK